MSSTWEDDLLDGLSREATSEAVHSYERRVNRERRMYNRGRQQGDRRRGNRRASDRTAHPASDRTARPASDRTARPASDRTARPASDRTARPANRYLEEYDEAYASQEYRPFRRNASAYESRDARDVRARTGKSGNNKKTQTKRILLRVGIGVVALVLVLVAVELGFNINRIHRGVTVSGVDVGGMSVQDAEKKLENELSARVEAAQVTAVPSETCKERLAAASSSVNDDSLTEEQKAELAAVEAELANQDGTSGKASAATPSTSWLLTAQTLGAVVDGETLAQSAYQVGRSGGFLESLFTRVRAWFGLDVTGLLTFDEELIKKTDDVISDVIGIPMVNCTLTIGSDGAVSVVPGSKGEHVDLSAFESDVSRALLAGGENQVVVPMAVHEIDIDEVQASAVAQKVRDALATPVTIDYSDQTWELKNTDIAPWIKTRVDGEGETATLVPYLDAKPAEPAIQVIMGDVGYGSAVDAYVEVQNGSVVIQGGTEGEGPDIKGCITKLNDILFGAGGERHITLTKGLVLPEVTVEDVQAYGITEVVASYKLGYGSATGDNREFNIERALDIADNSIVAPGETWDWHAVVGNCSYDNGFKGSGAIENGESVTQEGGGICNAATAIYNAAFIAGLPIIERTNHSIYISSYPLGRDATVSWRSPNMVFKNDMKHHILISTGYDGYNIYISIWGTSEGRSISSSCSDWSYTSNGGSRITNWRNVYDADGNLMWEDTFVSTFRPPKSAEQPAEPEESTDPVDDSGTEGDSDDGTAVTEE